MTRFSLDLKVLSLIGFVILLMTLGSLFLFKRLADQAQSQLFDAMDSMSFAVHHAIAGQFYERYYDVQAFAQNPSIQSLEPARIEQTLNTYVRLYEIYDLILVVDEVGQLLATNTLDPEGQPFDTKILFQQNFANEPWFKAVTQKNFTNEEVKGLQGSFVEDPQVDPYLRTLRGTPELGNSFSAPITDGNGHLLGVITNRAGIRWIGREFSNAYDMFQSGGFSDVRLELLGSQGETLFEPKPIDPAIKPKFFAREPQQPFAYLGFTGRTTHPRKWSILNTPDQKTIVGYAAIKDSKFPEVLGWGVRIFSSETTATQGLSRTVRISYFLIILTSVVILFLAVAYARHLVINRTLKDQVNFRTSELNQVAQDLAVRNEDLERSRMDLVETNDQLVLAQKELLETAKRLGQSEVASLTLHNIGNIITSLNIQSSMIREGLEAEPPGQVSRMYLRKIQNQLKAEEAMDSQRTQLNIQRIEDAEVQSLLTLKELMRGLIDNVRMAMSAISSQVAFVQRSEAHEELALTSLLRHIIGQYEATFKRHIVEVEMDLQQDCRFLTERFRMESILTVLIRNAIDAMIGMKKRKVIFQTVQDELYVSLHIIDSGVGFDPDTSEKLFRFGFTTKRQGHGFGLHYAANSCKHLGIQLKLESPGPGLGAVATLIIPKEILLV